MISTARILTALDALLIVAAWVDYLDIAIRVGSGLAAIYVAYHAARAYIAQKKLAEKQMKDSPLKDKVRPANGKEKQ